MTMEFFSTILSATLVTNLMLSLINAFAYGYGYIKTSRAKVDGKLSLTKKTLLFEFIILIVVTGLLSYVYTTVIFDRDHTTEALYLLNFTLLIFNIGFIINAILLSLIVRKG